MRFRSALVLALLGLWAITPARAGQRSAAAPGSPAQQVARMQRDDAWVARASAALVSQAPDPSFVKYRDEYLTALPVDAARPLTRAALDARLAGARIVLVGDQHESPEAKELALSVLAAMRKGGGAVSLAIEFIHPEYQRVLDAYAAGSLDESALRERAYRASAWSFPWPPYRQLLAGAKAAGVPVVAVEPGTHLALVDRDRGIAERTRAIPGRVLVFYGSYHLLGPAHLAARLDPDVTITPSAQDFYWTLARRFGLGFDLLELSPRIVFANQGSPLEGDAASLRSLMDAFGYGSFAELATAFPALKPVPAHLP